MAFFLLEKSICKFLDLLSDSGDVTIPFENKLTSETFYSSTGDKCLWISLGGLTSLEMRDVLSDAYGCLG